MYPRRYVGKHLKPRPKKHGPAILGTAAVMWVAGPAAQAASGGHVVRSGDTLMGIAARYGTSVTQLARANHISNPDLIVIGTTLKIAGGAERSHRVVRGETLSGIAARYGVPIRSLARLNHLADPNLIVAGTTLKIPGSTYVPAAHTGKAIGTSIGDSLARHSSAAGIDPSLVKAVAWHESGWQQDVVSSAGAIGVMQVMPDTADYVNVVLGGGSLDVHRADDNVKLGVMYLSQMLHTMRSENRALAAYYSGPGNVRGRLNSEQRAYVAAVQANRSRY